MANTVEQLCGEIKRLKRQLQAIERCVVNNGFDRDEIDDYQENMAHYQKRIAELSKQMCHLSVIQTKAQMTR